VVLLLAVSDDERRAYGSKYSSVIDFLLNRVTWNVNAEHDQLKINE
jgi:hypothetical protein